MKRKFYVVESYQRKGPYNIDELKNYGITKDTLIWAFEFNEPKKAGDIDELSEIFIQNDASEQKDKQEKTDSYGKTLLKTEPKLSDEELLKQYEEIKKQEEEKKKEETIHQNNKEEQQIPLSKDDKTATTPIVDKNTNDQKETEEKVEVNQDNEIESFDEDESEEINIENNQNKEPEELLFESTVENKQTNEESNSIIIEKKTEQTYNKEYESTIGPKDIPEKPKNYTVWSILVLLFCCSPFAIISLITGSQVEKKFSEGDYAGAEQSSKTTLTILIISIILSVVGVIIMLMADYK